MSKVQLPANPFSHLHLAPTLLDAMNVESPAEFRGHSHWPQLQQGSAWDEPAIVESIASCTNPKRSEARLGPRVLTVRDARYKLVLYFNPPHDQLFDLKADPVEQKPLPQDAEKAVRGRLLEYARLHLQSSWQERNPKQQVSSRLRDLQLQWANQHTNSSR